MKSPRVWSLIAAVALFVVPGLLLADKERRSEGKALHLHGVLTQVDPDRKEVTVRSKDKEWQMVVDERSHLRQEGHAAALSDFKKGMQVRVRYDVREGKNHVLRMRARYHTRMLSQEFRKGLQGFASQAHDKREELQKRLENSLQQIDERIEDLEDHGKNLNEEGRKRFEADLKVQAKEKTRAARKELGQLKSSTADRWEGVKKTVQDALNQMQKAYDRAHDDVKDAPEK